MLSVSSEHTVADTLPRFARHLSYSQILILKKHKVRIPNNAYERLLEIDLLKEDCVYEGAGNGEFCTLYGAAAL